MLPENEAQEGASAAALASNLVAVKKARAVAWVDLGATAEMVEVGEAIVVAEGMEVEASAKAEAVEAAEARN
jgi:tartrate dehydratase beta subunit/fumarate hydratase class I family protein